MKDLCGVDEVDELVRAFYRLAAVDELLGPIFETANVDWAGHIPKLVEFWSWQLFGIRGYEGHPLRAHQPLQVATPFREEHYRRWLELFEETLDDRFTGPVTELARERARKMAAAMRRLLDGQHDSGAVPVGVTVVAPGQVGR
jgi:hemoglobin